jgi:glycine/D-amino acid oxidase-like deaminating enzyme
MSAPITLISRRPALRGAGRLGCLDGAVADVVVVGAGIVGAACAYYAARAGLQVTIVDRGPVAGGTTGAGEGNLLVSDKVPGPELDLTLYSLSLWRALRSTMDTEAFELEPKGGLMVALDPGALDAIGALGQRQREVGVDVVEQSPADLREREPYLGEVAGGAFYPQDMQVQPMLAAAHLVRTAVRDHGATRYLDAPVIAIERGSDGRVTGVRTTTRTVPAGTVVNAAGTWAGEVAALAGVALPILPRRGFILVTEPLPTLIRHKVYAAEYLSNVASDAAELESSGVVEGTRSGTVLIGASRERVGFTQTYPLAVLRRLAAQAVRLFPMLAGVHTIRCYRGFRPYSPDHLPVIGADPRVPGLLHACGHEGAGIGLAPATGDLIAALITGSKPALDPTPFRPERFDAAG